MAILEHKMSAQGANMFMWGRQLGSIASKGFTSCRTYRWEIL